MDNNNPSAVKESAINYVRRFIANIRKHPEEVVGATHLHGQTKIHDLFEQGRDPNQYLGEHLGEQLFEIKNGRKVVRKSQEIILVGGNILQLCPRLYYKFTRTPSEEYIRQLARLTDEVVTCLNSNTYDNLNKILTNPSCVQHLNSPEAVDVYNHAMQAVAIFLELNGRYDEYWRIVQLGEDYTKAARTDNVLYDEVQIFESRVVAASTMLHALGCAHNDF